MRTSPRPARAGPCGRPTSLSARGRCSGGPTTPCGSCAPQYLPERETDLALASLVGQWGLVAGAAAVLAAIILVWRLALASRASRTPHGALVGGGLAILLGIETVVSVGRQPRAPSAGGRPVPAAQLRRNGAGRPPGRDRGRPGRPPGRRPAAAVGAAALAEPAAAAGPAGRARRCRCCWSSFGLYGWRLQTTQGEALLLAGAGADDAVLPAACTARVDHRPARRAARRERRGRRPRRGPGARGAGPAARPAGGRRPSRGADRAPARGPARADRVGGGPDAVAARGRGATRHRRRGQRGRDRRRVRRPGAASGLPGRARCSARCSASPGWPRRTTWSAGPTCRRARSSAAPGSSSSTTRCCAGSTGGSASTSTRGRAGRARRPQSTPCRGTDLRLSLDLGLQRQLDASLAAAVRAQPRPRGKVGAAVAMDPRSGQVLAMASAPSFDNNVYGPPVDRAALKAWPTHRGHRCSST